MGKQSERIGFVGVGRMGSAMLRRMLDAGYHATLCDPSEQALAPFLASHPELVRVAAKPREAALVSDVIEVVVNTDEQLQAACLGEDGILAGAKPNSVVLVHSTVSHETLQRLAKVAQTFGVQLLDAPVSGARGHLSVGNLAVMVGGDAQAFARAQPVMETYGSVVLHLGPLGAGLDAKLAIKLLRYQVMAASQEAALLAERAGPKVGKALAQLVAHTESNRFVGDIGARWSRMKELPLQQRQKDAELAQKDLRAAAARAAELGFRLPGTEGAVNLMHRLWGAEPLYDEKS